MDSLPACLPACRCLQEQADGGGEEEGGFRIAGGGASAKGGLELVHLVHGLGPPAELDDGSSGVAPQPGGGARAAGGFAAAARAEHTTEADLFRRLLLSRGGA
jgi:hypothetical protein